MASPRTAPPTIPRAGAPQTVTLRTYNSIRLEPDDVYTLVTQYCGAYYINILNLGPCTVYYRSDANPFVNDPDSVTLPPGAADNLILIPDGPAGVRVMAGAPCVCQVLQDIDDPDCDAQRPLIGLGATISVRLVTG